MESYFLARDSRLWPVAGEGGGMNAAAQGVLLAAETPDVMQGLLMLLLLLFLFPMARRLYRNCCSRRLAARMRGHNHPAIPAITYPSARHPPSPEKGKQKKHTAAASAAVPSPEAFQGRDSSEEPPPKVDAPKVDAPGVDAPGVDAPGVDTAGNEETRTEIQGGTTSATEELHDTDAAAELDDYTFYSLLDRMDIE
ncbi:hypothetical protein [Cesiribacter sp. SM1]|uniref:hypothetical protein n=1 Tax=Cesiribacter sp. SM1 TaxID=2861196 RepID=UPI001CD6B476|nr:hypothetical protein [Cesiribacter sp. SM1]